MLFLSQNISASKSLQFLFRDTLVVVVHSCGTTKGKGLKIKVFHYIHYTHKVDIFHLERL